MINSSLLARVKQTLPALLRTWVVIWLLAVPLFHVHLDADHHHHSEFGHLHAVTVHTVFSQDLDGEFESHETEYQEAEGLFTHSTHSSHDHPELGFSFLSDSTDRKVFKPLLASIGFVSIAVTPLPEGHKSVVEQDDHPAPILLLIQECSSRAPPAVLA